MTIPRIPSGLIYALAGALLAGLCLRGCAPHPVGPAVVRVDTADASAWRERADQLARQVREDSGKLATFRRAVTGEHAIRPERVTVYDTVIQPDTVLLFATIEGGRTVSRTIGIGADTLSGYQPASIAAQPYGNCDRRLSIAPDGRVQCVPARFGHLVAFAGAGAASSEVWASGLPPPVAAYGAVGLSWTPSFRSTWSAEIRVEQDGRAVAAVRKGVRLW